MTYLRSLAAANNAALCNVVCRNHGATTRFDPDAWVSETRTPPYYPDAVTLVSSASASDLLARIDASLGCSIKDSFASLDLAGFGFRVLFDAEWVARPPTGAAVAPEGSWEVVREPGIFDDPSVSVLVARDGGRITASAVLNRTPPVVGISNVTGDWLGCLGLAETLFPETTLVGYAWGSALDAMHRQGFESVGPLRVWTNDD